MKSLLICIFILSVGSMVQASDVYGTWNMGGYRLKPLKLKVTYLMNIEKDHVTALSICTRPQLPEPLIAAVVVPAIITKNKITILESKSLEERDPETGATCFVDIKAQEIPYIIKNGILKSLSNENPFEAYRIDYSRP